MQIKDKEKKNNDLLNRVNSFPKKEYIHTANKLLSKCSECHTIREMLIKANVLSLLPCEALIQTK